MSTHIMGPVLFSGDESADNYQIRCPMCSGVQVSWEAVYVMSQLPPADPDFGRTGGTAITSEFTAYENSYATCDDPECGHDGTLADFTTEGRTIELLGGGLTITEV